MLDLTALKPFADLFFLLAVAGKAHPRDRLMSWYSDHIVLRCEEPSGHPAALRLALHHPG